MNPSILTLQLFYLVVPLLFFDSPQSLAWKKVSVDPW